MIHKKKMEDSFSLTWEDAGTVVQNEEVICSIEETEIIPGNTEEFQDEHEVEIVDESVVQDEVEIGPNGIMYLSDNNVLVMQDPNDDNDNFPQHLIDEDCQVTEEVIADQWDENCQEEIVVGSEEAIGVSGEQAEDIEIPLPTDQDEYTAARPYPCDFCSRRFRKKANLMNHMVAHQTDKPHGCNLCGIRYLRKCDLMNHLKIHAYIPDTVSFDDENDNLNDGIDGDKMRKNRNRTFNKRRKKQKIKEEFDSFEGDEMDGVVASSSSKNYYSNDELMEVKSIEYVETDEMRYPITDHRKPFVCQHCGVGFAREKALASHSRIHGGDSPFECQKCNEMFWDAASMREHWRTKHGGLENLEDEDEDDDYSEDDHKYGTFYCTTCGLSFHRQDNLKRHQRIHVKDEMLESELGHICNVCGESFPEALDLLAHAEIHARSSENRCMICGDDFEDEQGCAVHVQEKHGDDLPPNTCMLCGRQCKDRRTLLKHSWEHSKQKVFSCAKCSKVFHNKARLKRHMLSHRNKVVNCDVCGEEFPDGRSLMNHRHSHSSVSGRQFPCRECGKTFGSRSSQQIHIRIHTGERPYGCRFCWKAFADGGTLRKHERIHTGEKPYACAVCPRAFNQRVVLREHIRSHHSGPDPKYAHSMTPYCCSVCSDMFATSQDLIVHLIHHCDLNTAMNRQPQVGPRKYKRRRKLKPHELGMLQQKLEEEQQQQQMMENIDDVGAFTESDLENKKKRVVRRTKRQTNNPPEIHLEDEEDYIEHHQPEQQELEEFDDVPHVQSEVTIPSSTIKISPGNVGPFMKKKTKNDIGGSGNNVSGGGVLQPPSRPKMIHTQKTRVALEPGEDGRIRHKTKTTIITRTQSTELKSVTGDRIRPRTKNVSYHVFNSDKIPLATFPEDVTAVNNLLKEENQTVENNANGMLYLHQMDTPEVAVEQTVETEVPVPTNLIRIQRKQPPRRATSLKPGRHIIGPGSKVRMIKSGMIVKKKDKSTSGGAVGVVKEELLIKEEPNEQEHLIKEEFILSEEETKMNSQDVEEDPSPLHELAEISMQHAQNLFRCEMCSAVFSDRAQLLVHVPIHI